MVPNVIFCCCIKDCGIENHEFAVLIITLGVFSVLSDFSSGFSVLEKILAGFSVSDRPQSSLNNFTSVCSYFARLPATCYGRFAAYLKTFCCSDL